MLDFKKSINYFCSGIQWYYLVFLLALACLSLISDTMAVISLMLVLIFGISILGAKLSEKLGTPKKSIILILKNAGVFLFVSFIFLLLQYIFMIVGMLPFLIMAKDPNMLANPADFEVLLYSAPGWQLGIAVVVLLLFLFGVALLEVIKAFGMGRYFKTGKFKDLFKIKESVKSIFTKDYLTIFVFLCGVLLINIIIYIVFLFLLNMLFEEVIAGLISSVILILISYIVMSTHYYLVYELIQSKK